MNQHLSQDLIMRRVDDELTPAEQAQCTRHLELCKTCRQLANSWQDFSLQVEAAIQTAPLPEFPDLRASTQQAIESQAAETVVLHNPVKVMRRFGWAMALAAVLAIGIVVTTKEPGGAKIEAAMAVASPTNMIDVDGESFFPLPYSNAELTTAAPHIVQMQVPVSSLTEAGIWVEPAARQIAAETGRSVLANVLVGADGQPRGVHVLSVD